MSDERPVEGSIWTHYNGREYRVLFIANDNGNDKYPPHVVYENTRSGTKWSRLLSDWHRSMTQVK